MTTAVRPDVRSADGAQAELATVSRTGDRVYRGAITFFAACIPLLLVLIAWEIFVAAAPALSKFGVGFLTSSAWDPVAGTYGAAPAIFGTLVSSAIALIVATPLA